MSIYLISLERNLYHNNKFIINTIKYIEKIGTYLPDMLLIDTIEYVKWFERTHKTKSNRFRLIPTGADEDTYQPITCIRQSNDKFNIIYYGSFIPNHGVSIIIEAARLLAYDQKFHFTLIGDGPDKDKAIKLVQKYHLINVSFIGWMNKLDLVQLINNSADICLGAFGSTPQSLMTIQNKVYECMAMGKVTITGDSSSVRASLLHAHHIYLCKRNPESLAQAIIKLESDQELRNSISRNARDKFLMEFSSKQLGRLAKLSLKECINQKKAIS